MFELYSKSINNFKDLYYLVMTLTEVPLTRIYNIEFQPPFWCSGTISKLWLKSHIMANIGSYVYNSNNLS